MTVGLFTDKLQKYSTSKISYILFLVIVFNGLQQSSSVYLKKAKAS